MASRIGTEARFTTRFARFGDVSSESIVATDEARKVTDQLNTARGIITTQQENITALFSTATEVLAAIDHYQQSSGIRQVKNIPPPTQEIKAVYGKQLGYVQMTMRFLGAGMTHFMHELISAKERVEQLEKLVGGIAEYTGEIPVVGQLQQIDFDDFETDEPIVETKTPLVTGSTTSEGSRPSTSQSSSPTSKTSVPAKKIVQKKK